MCFTSYPLSTGSAVTAPFASRCHLLPTHPHTHTHFQGDGRVDSLIRLGDLTLQPASSLVAPLAAASTSPLVTGERGEKRRGSGLSSLTNSVAGVLGGMGAVIGSSRPPSGKDPGTEESAKNGNGVGGDGGGNDDASARVFVPQQPAPPPILTRVDGDEKGDRTGDTMGGGSGDVRSQPPPRLRQRSRKSPGSHSRPTRASPRRTLAERETERDFFVQQAFKLFPNL